MEDFIKIIVTDDKERYRKAIREMLEPFPVSVIAEAGNGKQLLALLHNQFPDIVLLDLEMPVMNGNETFEIIRKKYPELKVIILSYYYETVLMENYIDRGAKGYLPKEALEPALLAKALEIVRNGGSFLYDNPVNQEKFTTRQQEIIPLIFEGLTNEEIAERIFISRRAVEKQRHKIYQKSGADRVIDFYKYAFTKGLQFLGVHKKGKKLFSNP